MKNIVITESEQHELDLFNEEFEARGGMSTQELIVRLQAVTLEEFMKSMSEKIRNYKR